MIHGCSSREEVAGMVSVKAKLFGLLISYEILRLKMVPGFTCIAFPLLKQMFGDKNIRGH